MDGSSMGRDGISKFIFCPMADPDIGELERQYINEALIDNQIGAGRFVALFEDAWANYNKYNYGVSCNSGTNAIFLALKASGAKKVLISNFTMAGTAWPAMYAGMEIDYIKTQDELPLSDLPDKVENYDAIVFAHLYGRMAYPKGYVQVLKDVKPSLIVIDDMAEAHGIMPEGDIACYSFYGNKIITTGEGGMCLTNDGILADEMRSLANMYFDAEHSMVHPKVGYNFRMTNLQAAVGLAQVERIKEILEIRQKIASWYDRYLPESIQLPKREVVWFYDIKVKNAERARKKLKSRGVESRRMFYPCSLQPWSNGMSDKHGEWWYKHGLLLPVNNKMVEGDVKYICETLLN